MCVSTVSGTVHVYVTRVPVLGASSGVTLALLSSLTEIAYYPTIADAAQVLKP